MVFNETIFFVFNIKYFLINCFIQSKSIVSILFEIKEELKKSFIFWSMDEAICCIKSINLLNFNAPTSKELEGLFRCHLHHTSYHVHNYNLSNQY